MVWKNKQKPRFCAGGLSSKVAIAQTKAIHWLERNMKLLEEHGQPFEIAIVAYALMRSKAPNAEAAFIQLAGKAHLEGGLMYWARERVPQPPFKIENQKPFLLPRLPYTYDSENIEATAYGLMVYVARQEIFVDNIVRWLNTQRLTDGGWASTSDTANAMRALIEYTSAQRIRDISSLSVSIEATALPGKTQVMYVNDRNRAQLQYIDIPEAWGTVKVQAKGTGYAILQMSVQYNVDIQRFQTQPPVKAFDLVTKTQFYGRNHSHISFVCCQRYVLYILFAFLVFFVVIYTYLILICINFLHIIIYFNLFMLSLFCINSYFYALTHYFFIYINLNLFYINLNHFNSFFPTPIHVFYNNLYFLC